MLWGATRAFQRAGLPCIPRPAAAGPGSQCWCWPQRGGWDNLFLQLTAKRWRGLILFACWEAKPIPGCGFGKADAFRANTASGVSSLYKTLPGERDVLIIIILMHFKPGGYSAACRMVLKILSYRPSLCAGFFSTISGEHKTACIFLSVFPDI